ncbi:Alpha/Beta hydrolase protein [Aspergillus navahoensis]
MVVNGWLCILRSLYRRVSRTTRSEKPELGQNKSIDSSATQYHQLYRISSHIYLISSHIYFKMDTLPHPPTPLTAPYKQINSSTITADIYLPPPQPPQSDNEPTHYPVLINIHGGAFMLGHSRMVSLPQISDCLARGWIVAVPNHRLCPGVDVLSGPMADIRDFLAWIYAGQDQDGLDSFLQGQEKEYRVDRERVMAFGTSSGGFLALSLGYDVPRRPKAILDFYGAVHFTHPSWTQPLPHVKSMLPSFEPEFLAKVYTEFPIPTSSGISLEGPSGARNKPDFSRPRDAFALTQIANGNVLRAIFPPECGDIRTIDPVVRVETEEAFPPTFIVHGDRDRMVSVEVSRELYRVLRERGVECGIVEVEGEDHTFAMGMEVGSRTWIRQREGFEWLEKVIR